ncbi:aromatic acid exporter family protein [Bacillus infantis]|nr:aromatic acid exporter family protein [Bacillus infantis]
MKAYLFNFAGGRIVKTGIAVFVTAFICHLLDWPAMFAVITAIVTIEPTAADSIRKAFIRLPASAIGAGFAAFFAFLFGDSPFSYAFVSLATIIVCHRLRLYEGTVVAVLTGAAMISTVHDHYAASFFIRLGTTCTGLIVSSLVNIFIMPPQYSKTITLGIDSAFEKASSILMKAFTHISSDSHSEKAGLLENFHQLSRDTEKIEKLCLYQKDEWRFHRFTRKEIRCYRLEYKKLIILRQLIYHIGNLVYLPKSRFSLDLKTNASAMPVMESLSFIFKDKGFIPDEDYQNRVNALTQWFNEQKETFAPADLHPHQHHHISPAAAVLYEILSLHDLAEELIHIRSLEERSKELLQLANDTSSEDR